MTQILAFMLFGLAGVAGYGATRALLPHASRDRLGLWATTLALAVGVLTQAMLWVALVLPGRLGPGSALAGLAVLVVAGALVLRRPRPADLAGPSAGGPTGAATRALAVAVLAVSVAILLGAVLWPFRDGDALAVYGPLGRVIAATGSLPVGQGLYEAYPMQVPMLYAAIEWLCGGPSEYLSRFATAALAVGAVAAAGWLARELGSARAGWLAAALLAACPVYCTWSTTGYADISAGFFVAVAAVFAWRWWHVAAAAAVAAVVAAPFYLRNLVVFGFAVPATVWTDRARHDLAGLLDPLRPERGFGLLGWAVAAAAVVCLGRLVRARGAAPAEALLLCFAAPFIAAWWWCASYDPRFLVTLLPLAAGFTGWLLDEAIASLEASHPRHARQAAVLVVTAVLVGTPFSLRRAVEHKRELLAHPLMGDLERHRLQVGGLFELGGAIDRLPSGARVAGVPEAARFYLAHDRLRLVAWASPAEDPCSNGFDYRVFGPLPPAGPVRPSCLGETVFRTSDGYELVRTATARGAGEVGEK